MTQKHNDLDPKAYNPKFQWHFLAPKYWSTWAGILFSIPFAFLPLTFHRWLATKVAKKSWLKPKDNQPVQEST